MLHVREASHLDFNGNGDLLLDFFGGAARPLRDDLDVVVGDVGIGFDGKLMERDGTPGEEEESSSDNQPAIVQREIDEAANHLRATLLFARNGASSHRDRFGWSALKSNAKNTNIP